jgi:hypothetical protein
MIIKLALDGLVHDQLYRDSGFLSRFIGRTFIDKVNGREATCGGQTSLRIEEFVPNLKWSLDDIF